METWILSPPARLFAVAFSTVVVYGGVIAYTRLFGLRSFSKMSSFDFAMTVSVGSALASTALNPEPTLTQGLVVLFVLFALQYAVSRWRRDTALGQQTVDNQPLLLMHRNRIFHDNLRRARLTESDLRGKLREANVVNRSQVRAVVFETTGDVSVLYTDNDLPLEAWLLDGVRGWPAP